MISVFLKKRSYLGCIKSSLDMYGENFVKIFKKVWIWCILMAVTTGTLAAVGFPNFAGNNAVFGSVVFVVLSLIAFFVDIKIKSLLFSFLNNKTGNGNFISMLKVGVTCVCIALFAFAALALLLLVLAKAMSMLGWSQESADISFSIAMLLLCIAAAVLVLPFSYSSIKCMLEGSGIKGAFIHGYRTGLRRVGFLFTLFVVLMLITGLISSLFILPGILVITADKLNDFGMSLGDPTGLPSCFAALKFVAAAQISLFGEAFSFWAIIVLCHAYGNIETGYREKNIKTLN